MAATPPKSGTKGAQVRRGMRILEAPNAFGAVVKVARFGWNTAWQLMMQELAPSTSSGAYVRPENKLTGSGKLVLEDDLVLYQGVACGWCHRVMLGRTLYGLEDRIKVVTLVPGDDGLWRLPAGNDNGNGSRLKDIYAELAPGYRGRFTAPLLVNGTKGEIVSNESADILDLLAQTGDNNSSSNNNRNSNSDLIEEIQDRVNNGVYKVGFARTQAAYDMAERELFETLDKLDGILTTRDYVCDGGGYGVEDMRLFPTAYRFDAIYSLLFKASRKSIRIDYPHISRWLARMYAIPGVKDTCDIKATRKHYFASLFPLNPGGIIPNTPDPLH